MQPIWPSFDRSCESFTESTAVGGVSAIEGQPVRSVVPRMLARSVPVISTSRTLCNSIALVADEWGRVGLRDVWLVVKASAERRLGKPLLLMYLVLAIAGAGSVAVSLLAMRL
jgi:hypothetical protein